MLFDLVFAIRLKKILDSITDKDQSGFYKQQMQFINIKLILNLMDYFWPYTVS